MVPAPLAKYLDTLPNGVASYPECCVKASVLRHNIGARPLGPEVELPPLVRQLVDNPPPVTEWIPEVHFNLAMLAIRELHFNAPNFNEYRVWAYAQNRKLLGAPLYRVLFALLSPERLLRGIEKRWAAFRRGTEFHVANEAVGRAELRIHNPAFLYPELALQGMAMALQAAIDSAGARSSQVELVSQTSTECLFKARW
jgi:hypothetical protein